MSLVDSLELEIGIDATQVNRGLGSIGAGLGRLAGLAAMAGGALAGMVGVFARGVVQAGSEMEAYETQLGTLMGSTSEAQARMEELFEFAATTPFEVGQIVSAEVTLRGFGAAAEELMPGLIDFAATTRTDLSQAAIDIGKAWNQGATGLESDAGKILRKQVELREGMDATDMSLQQFRESLLETMNEGMFAGGAERLSKTMTGMVSNLADEWTRFKLEVADAGFFNNVKGALSVTLQLIGDNREALGEIASFASTTLWKGFVVVGDVVAVILTGIEGWGIAMAALGSPLLKVQAAMQAALVEPTLTAYHLLSEITGVPVPEFIQKLETGIHQGQVALVGLAGEMDAFVTRKLEEASTPLQKWRGFIEDAEAAALGFGSAIDDLALDKAAGTGAGPGEDAGGRDKESERLAREFDAALEFSDQMRALDDSETERVEAEYDARLVALQAYIDQGLLSGQLAAEAEVAIRADRDRQLSAIDEAMRAEEEARAKEAAAQRQALQQATLDGFVGVWQGMLSTYGAFLDKEEEMQKASATTSILVSTAEAIMKSFSQFGWPAGIGPAALVGIQSGLQIAAVNKAHQGTGWLRDSAMAPDERKTTLRQEAVLNSQATRSLGAQGVMELNGGNVGGVTMLELTVGRQVQREVVRAGLAAGAEIDRAIQRRAGDSNLDAGFSGRVALP